MQTGVAPPHHKYPGRHTTIEVAWVPFHSSSSTSNHQYTRAVASVRQCWKMSRNNGKVGSKLQELRLSLSRSSSSSRGGAAGGSSGATTHNHGGGGGRGSPRRLSSSSSSTASPPSSCVSSEGSPEAGAAGAPMILAGCPRCMMYVMLSREDPRCPKCHSTVLLDFNDGPNDPRHAKGKGGKRG